MSTCVFAAKNLKGKTSRKKIYIFSLVFAVMLFFCSSIFITTVSAATSSNVYVDPKLGFSLQVPNSWNAQAYPGTDSSTTTSGVTFSITSSSQDQIGISVIRDTDNPQGFAQRGTPTLQIGNYPAFKYATPKQAQYPLACDIRVMLAGNDLVTATWCSPQTASASQSSLLESVLATYESQSSVQPSVLHTNTVNPVESCQDVINASGTAYQGGDWGIQQGNPTDAQWTASFNPGEAVCDNFINSSTPYSGYLFQCVELANRFAREQWGIAPGFTVDAANYFDYYQGGTFYQGQARTLYGNNVQLSSDASQGTSSFAPTPGDLLVWQSVNNPGVGWTSGLTSGPGHVAVITNVDASHVYIAQQNYSESQYYATLTLTKVANGWAISGQPFYDTGIITRGWIHFNANPYTVGSSSSTFINGPATAKNSDGRLEVFNHNSNGTVQHDYQKAANGGTAGWSGWSTLGSQTFSGGITVGSNLDGHLEVFAINNGSLYHSWQDGSPWSAWTQLGTGQNFADSTPSVVRNSDGRLEVFAQSKDGVVRHAFENAANGGPAGWSDWVRLNTNSFSGGFAVGSNLDGHLEVFAIDNGSLYHSWQNGSQWSAWTQLGTAQGFANGSPSVGADADGRLEVLAVTSSTVVEHTFENAVNGGPAGWGDWIALNLR